MKNILLNLKIREVDENVIFINKSFISNKSIIYKIFNDVFLLLFDTTILPYDINHITSKIIIKDKTEDINYMAKV